RAALVGRLRGAVDALPEHAQALAHRDDLPEEAFDRDRLLLRAGAPRLQDQLTAGPAVGDLAADRLLRVQHGADGLDDLAQVGVVEHRSAVTDPIESALPGQAGTSFDPVRVAFTRHAMFPCGWRFSYISWWKLKASERQGSTLPAITRSFSALAS